MINKALFVHFVAFTIKRKNWLLNLMIFNDVLCSGTFPKKHEGKRKRGIAWSEMKQ